MRFLHTSDWHLGRTFNTRSRYDEQVAFIDWFAAQAEALKVDGIFIAGDVYDRSAPSEESVDLLDSAANEIDLRAPRPVVGQYVLLWFTGLPLADTGSYVGGIREALVRG